MSGIFISYRRKDTAAYAGRPRDELVKRFGATAVFRDVETIAPGEDWATAIERAVAELDVMLVLIGRDWLSEARLDDPTNILRREIELALVGNILVIPVLVGNAAMPSEKELPASLRQLGRRKPYPSLTHDGTPTSPCSSRLLKWSSFLDGRGRRPGDADHSHRLALIEAAHGWEVPARLAWSGATNHDLTGAQNVAVLRRWNQRYGGELLTLGLDTIELLVDRPPTSKEEALAVAREHFAYCPDIVWQGVGSIGALAATQARSRLWYFWWD